MSDVITALRARIRLERPQREDDEIGGGAIVYEDAGDAWAEISASGGSESNAFDIAPSRVIYRVELRARADLRAGWRIVWGARVLRVTARRDEGGPRIVLICEEETL